MKVSIVNEEDKVVNIIEHDGASPLNLAPGLRAVQTNDWVHIGDNIDKALPVPPSDSEADLKQSRNQLLKLNLALVGCYRIEKKSNPALTFSDYLDELEKEKVD